MKLQPKDLLLWKPACFVWFGLVSFVFSLNASSVPIWGTNRVGVSQTPCPTFNFYRSYSTHWNNKHTHHHGVHHMSGLLYSSSFLLSSRWPCWWRWWHHHVICHRRLRHALRLAHLLARSTYFTQHMCEQTDFWETAYACIHTPTRLLTHTHTHVRCMRTCLGKI